VYHFGRVGKSIREGFFVLMFLVLKIGAWLSIGCHTVYVASANVAAIKYSVSFIGTGVFYISVSDWSVWIISFY
jgi:hypothetical protein